MKTIKLLYVTEEILIENNAPTIHVLEACKNFKQFGFNVELFMPSLSQIKNNNLSIKRIFMTEKLKSLFFHPLLTIYLAYALYKEKNSIVYMRYFPLLILPILLCKLLNIECVVEVNGKIPEEAKLLNHTFLAKFYTLFDTINLKYATKIIAVTEGLKEYLESKYKINSDKIYVVKNGVDIDRFRPINQKLARKQTNLDIDKLYIGYIGSLYEYQGISYIIESAKIVNEKLPNAEFIIVGNGTQKEKKKIIDQIKTQKLENIIKIIGPIPHNKVADYINSFDICLCYPTTFRNNATSPFKLFEYLACNKAVITSDIKGLRNFFKNTVLYATPNNSKELAKKIISILLNKHLKTTLEGKGRQFIMNGHTWRDTIEKIVNKIKTKEIKNNYIHSNDFYIHDNLYSYLIYFDYFLSPGFSLAKYINNSYIRKLIFSILRAGVIFLYISQLYKLRYKISKRPDDAHIIFNGPGKWSSIIKLITSDGKLKIRKTVYNEKIYIREKEFYMKYRNNQSKIRLPDHEFLDNNTIDIDFLKTNNFLKLITDGSFNLSDSLSHYKKIKKEIKILYGNKNTLIHGDLWPGNIFPINNYYYLIDFGDSIINNYRYDLYVLLHSILSRYQDLNSTKLKSLKDTFASEWIDANNNQIEDIEKTFNLYRKRRFPNLYN